MYRGGCILICLVIVKSMNILFRTWRKFSLQFNSHLAEVGSLYFIRVFANSRILVSLHKCLKGIENVKTDSCHDRSFRLTKTFTSFLWGEIKLQWKTFKVNFNFVSTLSMNFVGFHSLKQYNELWFSNDALFNTREISSGKREKALNCTFIYCKRESQRDSCWLSRHTINLHYPGNKIYCFVL